jgi:hypothetical protein
MNDKDGTRAMFRGYAGPNYTPVPDELFDEQLPDLSGAELKVLLYVIRRTFGFKRESDNISLSQMLNGLRTRDGRILDRGVGLSKKTLLQAIKSLEEQNIILTERRRSQEKGDEPTSYRLNVRAAAAQEETTPPVGEKLHHGGGGKTPPPPWGKNSPTQETVVQETDCDLSKFERSHDEKKTERPGREEETTTVASSAEEAPDRLVPLAEIVRLRQQGALIGHQDEAGKEQTAAAGDSVPGRRGRPPGSVDDREHLMAYLQDFARELGDESPLASTVTRAYRIFAAANIPAARWSDYLYQARAVTQEHTGQITKRATDGGGAGPRQKNKMPYYFAVLEQLVGLRAEPEELPNRPSQSSA